MIANIGLKKKEIASLCRRFHVRRLEVFGSAARETDFDEARSDIDFLVEFEPGRVAEAFDAYFGLKEGLEALLTRPIDLVVEKALRNPYIRAEINGCREAVYGA